MSQDCSPGSPDGSTPRTPSGSAGESRTESAWLYDAGGWYLPLESAPIAGTFTLHERGLSSPPLPHDAPADVVNAARIELHERANRLDYERMSDDYAAHPVRETEMMSTASPFPQLSPEQEAALEEMMRRLAMQAFDNPTPIEPPEDETTHG